MRGFLAAYAVLLSLATGLAVAGGIILFDETGPSDRIEAAADRHAYDVLGWEIRHLPGKWLYKLGHLFDSRSDAEANETLRRYFALLDEIQVASRDAAQSGRLEALEAERASLENTAEDILEGRATAVLKDQGLAVRPPLFSNLGLLFPPVDFELDSPPRVLAVSPRERIELDRSYLLAPGLDRDTVDDIERQAEAPEDSAERSVSALVVPTGGVATYPSVVSQFASYESLVTGILHEWVHQYLVLFPLGRSYFASHEVRTLNETVADLAGRELARVFFERYPSPVAAPPAEPPAFDFTAEMRALRKRVEELLTAGRVEQAEALMERKRDEFEAEGVYIRRLNQAYFAFHGFYADSPGSIDPIGPKLQKLLESAGSPGRFLQLAAGITSAAELDRLLADEAG